MAGVMAAGGEGGWGEGERGGAGVRETEGRSRVEKKALPRRRTGGFVCPFVRSVHPPATRSGPRSLPPCTPHHVGDCRNYNVAMIGQQARRAGRRRVRVQHSKKKSRPRARLPTFDFANDLSGTHSSASFPTGPNPAEPHERRRSAWTSQSLAGECATVARGTAPPSSHLTRHPHCATSPLPSPFTHTPAPRSGSPPRPPGGPPRPAPPRTL